MRYRPKSQRTNACRRIKIVSVIFVVIFLLTSGLTPMWAQNAQGELVSYGLTLALTYQFPFEEIPDLTNVGEEALNNVRFNILAQLAFNASAIFGIGFETGLAAGFPGPTYRQSLNTSVPDSDLTSLMTLDVPVRAVIALDLALAVLDIYGGFLFQDIDSVPSLDDFAVDIGARIRFGLNRDFVVDIGYILPGEVVHPERQSVLYDYWSNTLRIGIGYRFGN